MKTLLRIPDAQQQADVEQIRRGFALREKQADHGTAVAWLAEIEVKSWGRCPGYAAAAVEVRREEFQKSLQTSSVG